MAKKKPNPNHYQFIRATESCGDLSWEYRLNGAMTNGSQRHDEEVGDWSDTDIRKLTRSMLDVEQDDPVVIEVLHD